MADIYDGFLVTLSDVAATQSPDTGQLTLSSLIPAGATRTAATHARIRTVWFDFITNSQAGTRDMGIEVRTPRASDGSVLHIYTVFAPTAQPASKTWIWTFSTDFGANFTSAAGNTLHVMMPDLWLPVASTFELDSTGPSGASDQFTNINLWIEVS